MMLQILSGVAVAGAACSSTTADDPIDIGSRLELFVDDYLIEKMTGAALVRHRPTPREVVVVHDEPWEGSGTGYHTVFRDGELYRMYYKGDELTVTEGRLTSHPLVGAYAESRDGIHWVKPELGLFEFNGSKKNNIVWMGPGAHDFTPFKDPNPNCTPEAKYKAVACGDGGLLAFKSPDGIHWSTMNDGRPIITKGAFDTQNLAFWDTVRGRYRAYIRDFRNGLRDIRTATSEDFIHWTEPVWLEYPGAPAEELYTNQIEPYYRAPHLFLGFPTRYINRGWAASTEALPGLEHRRLRSSVSPRFGTALTDGLFMTSRDGRIFQRWGEAFLRPGLRPKDNWTYGDNYQAWGVVETESDIPGAPRELSIYATESYWTDHADWLRRFTLRIDGFVSVEAPLGGGELVTRLLVFTGDKLVMNFSTSAAGSVQVEIQGQDGKPVEGFTLADCPEIYGDAIERTVSWKAGSDVRRLAGKSVRLRFVLKDADLYSIRFE